jgi:hypothetical protein
MISLFSPWPGLVRCASVRTPPNFAAIDGKLDGRRKPAHGEFGSVYPPSLSTRRARYTAAMTTSDVLPTPFIAAARARKQRGRALMRGEGGAPAPENNYIAETPKKRAGAEPGNQNARKHGWYSAASLARRAQLMARVRQFQRLVDAVLDDVEPHRG